MPQDIVYEIPDSVVEIKLHQQLLLRTTQGGAVAIDEDTAKVWRAVRDGTLTDIQLHDSTLATLACLCEAGLVQRKYQNHIYRQQPNANAIDLQVSVIIVVTSYKEVEWVVNDVYPDLQNQTHKKLQIILIDNHAPEKLQAALKGRSDVTLIRPEHKLGLAAALNAGALISTGHFLMFLNPDIRLERYAIENMVRGALSGTNVGAVTAKLKFLRAPSFLNGIGNRVRSYGWGLDNGIGQLDLGQLDNLKSVPSACSAAMLVPIDAWRKVGSFDERYIVYYDDADWSYRARTMGFEIRAAPQAEILHLFGGFWEDGKTDLELPPAKLNHACYGRLRFALKLVSKKQLGLFLKNYVLEDIFHFAHLLKRRRIEHARALMHGWWRIFCSLPEIFKLRNNIQNSRKVTDLELFPDEQTMPLTLEWNGFPVLTHDSIVKYYLPLVRQGQTRYLPEFG